MIRISTLFACFLFASLPAAAQLNGTYSVDAALPATAGNYQSVSAAVSDLASGTRSDGGPANGPGVTGPVTIRLTTGSGPYVEQITIPAITGASAVNTIRLSGGPGREMIMFSGTTTANRQVVKIDGARHIILDSLTLVNTDATYGYGVQITNSADSNVVSNCSVVVSTTATSANFAGITLSGATVATNGDSGDDNLIQNNNVNGGYYGITLRGTSSTVFNQRNKITGNNIQNFYYYGVYCYYQNLAEIKNNTISARPAATTAGYGIYLNTSDRFQVESNKLTDLGGYGIYSITGNYQGGTGTNRARIVNNMIGGGWTDLTSPYGIYITTNSRYIDIWHNSVSMNGGNGRGLYLLGGLGHDVRNNSFAVYGSATGYALYISSTAYVTTVNYNNYYAPGSANFIYIGSAYSTATYIGGGGFNANSRAGDPLYQNLANNLHTTGLQLFDAGTNAGVNVDIDGDPRPLAPTALYDIGADEFSPSVNDAGITALTSPAQPFGAGIQNISAVVYNYGAATLTSATINWDVNAVLQTPFAWTGSLATYTAAAPATIGTYNFLTGNTYTVRIWTSNPNGSADQQTANDTLTLTLCVGLNGVYTIGGVGADYATINAAVSALVCGGASGPVTFNLTQGAGPFNEQVIIPAIPGASAIRTIRINGGANRETVQFSATTTTLRAVIQLNGAKHIILDSLTITNTGATYGYGVQLTNSADSNIVQNCLVSVNATSTVSNFAGITISGATVATSGDFGDDNLIQNNTVSGGYYGITMRGAGTTNFNQRNKVIGNIVQNFYYYGIYCYYQNLPEVKFNRISARANATVAGYGIYMYYADRFEIESNKLVNLGGNGIYTYYGNYQGGTGTARARIVNNMIGGGWLDTTPYGIYMTTNSRHIDVWHNSVSMDNGNSRALYITGGLDNNVQNNSFAAFGSTTGYAAYITSAAYISVMDYNNYYAPGSANFIYIAGAYTPATYVGAGGFNSNSIDGDPFYINNTTNLHSFAAQLYDAGTNLGVMTDIDGDVRPLAPSTGYDIGADEYGVISDDIEVVTFFSPMNNACADSNTVISVIITNLGSDTIFTVPFTTIVTGYVNASINYTYNGSLAFGQTDTVSVATFNSYPNGVLNITVYSILPGDQNFENDTVSAQFTILPIAPLAVGTNDTACAGSPATLNVNTDGFAHNWYDASSGGNFLAAGDTFITPILSSTTTYFVEALSSSTGNLTTAYAGGNGCDGAMFDFIPSVNMNIDSFACNIGSTISETVAVFYRAGTYAGNETNMSAWTALGQVNVIGAGAGQPTFVPLGGINMIAGQTYGIYMTLASANMDYTNGSLSYTNGEATINTGSGLCGPFATVNAARMWNGTVFYTKEVCPNPVRTPITVTVLTPPSVSLGNDTTVCGSELLDAGNPGMMFLWSTMETTQQISATGTGTYFVSVNDGQCIGRDTIQLTVNPLPPVIATAANGSICNGETDTLTVSGATLYIWSSGGIGTTEIVSPFATTTYTVSGIDNNGCADSAVVTVTVNQLPTVSFTASNTSVCAGNSSTLNGTGASTYVWTGGVTNGIPFTPSVTSTYSVTGTDVNGCSDTSSATIVVNALPVVGYTASATTVCQNDSVTLNGTGASTYSWSGGVTNNIPFANAASGSYTVTGTDANGCTNTASVSISVNPAPNVGFTTTAAQVCAGGAVTLNGTGAVTYVWSGGVMNNVAFTPASTNSYTVTGTGANGCTATSSVTIIVNSLPNVTMSSLDTVCLNDGPLLLATGSPAGGTWSGTAVSGGSFSPAAAGNGSHMITYSYTDANSCSNSASQPIVVDPCTGIADAAFTSALFSIYPNPNSGQFTFVVNGVESADVVIYDALGQQVQSKHLAPGTHQLSIETPGVYLVTIITADGERSQHYVVVQR